MQAEYELSQIPQSSTQTPTAERTNDDESGFRARQWRRWKSKKTRPIFLAWVGLIFTTLIIVSSFFLRIWFPKYGRWASKWMSRHRPVTQMLVQVLSNALAMVHVYICGTLINWLSRSGWSQNHATLQDLRFWHALCTRNFDFETPLKRRPILSAYIIITVAPSAIWAAFLAPVPTHASYEAKDHVPAYRDHSSIREYPSDSSSQAPTLRIKQGRFGYDVGTQLQNYLLAAAGAAKPASEPPRRHSKLDNSGFTFIGRSYGVGASVGLFDTNVTDPELDNGYKFDEVGYETSFGCVHNETSDFRLVEHDNHTIIATGTLISREAGGDGTYFGNTSAAIVAFGVGRDSRDPMRVLSIAAGEIYRHLDKVQCTAKFHTTKFHVWADTTHRTISVSKALPSESAEVFRDGGNLTFVLMRQFARISRSQNSQSFSPLGSALNDTISRYITARAGMKVSRAGPSLQEATLRGLESALEAMADDMLVAYSSAQLMIARDFDIVDADVGATLLVPGTWLYSYIICGLHAIVAWVFIKEMNDCDDSAKVSALDYLDPIDLVCGTYEAQAEADPALLRNDRATMSGWRTKVIGSRIVLSRVEDANQDDDSERLVEGHVVPADSEM